MIQRFSKFYQIARRLAGKRVRHFIKKYAKSPLAKLRHKKAIEQNFPLLDISSISYISQGKDSIVFCVNGNLIFRFPKGHYALQQMEKQIKLLPQLYSLLSLPIPVYRYTALTPKGDYPFPFVGYEMIKGKAMDECPDRVFEETWWRMPLATFMKTLHSYPVEKAENLEVPYKTLIGLERIYSTWYETLCVYYDLIKEILFPILNKSQIELVQSEYQNFLSNPVYFTYKPALIHNDLDSNHVFLDLSNKQITGIIDFGESAIGDPALDVWESLISFYPHEGDPTLPDRVRFYRLLKTLETIIDGKKYHRPRKLIFGLNYLEETSKKMVLNSQSSA